MSAVVSTFDEVEVIIKSQPTDPRSHGKSAIETFSSDQGKKSSRTAVIFPSYSLNNCVTFGPKNTHEGEFSSINNSRTLYSNF